MKAKELIAALEKHDPDLPVCFMADDSGERYTPARFVIETNPLEFEHDGDGDTLVEPESEDGDNDALNYLAIE